MKIHKQAFSLIETLAVIAVVAVLALGAYTWFETITRYQIKNDLARLTQLISLANNTALGKKRLVTICKSSDGKSCGGEWQQGQLVFFDSGSHQVVDRGDIITFNSALSSGANLQWKGFQSDDYLSFTSVLERVLSNGTFYYKKQGQTKKIVIARNAHIRVEQ